MTTLTQKEIYAYLDNNPSFEDISKSKELVKLSTMPDKQKKQVLLALSWERAERREYIVALRELKEANL
tara:strand:+ start:288 stop:494 length:207 start_codon:yes stop_codon:yes gene_type:complete